MSIATAPRTELRSAWSQTPGVACGDNGTVLLDLDNEPQPDLFIRILPEFGGQSGDRGDYVAGAPELVAEVTASSASYDLHDKLRAYRRNGVREYVVWRVWDREIDWFMFREGTYERLQYPPRRHISQRGVSGPVAGCGGPVGRRVGPGDPGCSAGLGQCGARGIRQPSATGSDLQRTKSWNGAMCGNSTQIASVTDSNLRLLVPRGNFLAGDGKHPCEYNVPCVRIALLRARGDRRIAHCAKRPRSGRERRFHRIFRAC